MRNLKLECENPLKSAHAPRQTPMLIAAVAAEHVDYDVRLKWKRERTTNDQPNLDWIMV